MSYHYLFKFIIIGDTAVGKSCILYQFLEGKFRVKHEMTVGVEFGAKILDLQNKKIKLQIWDTAGQETFKSITRQYYRSAAGAILVYDITRKESFESIRDWIKECRTHGTPDMVIILVANKSDLNAQRKVQKSEGQKLAQENDMIFVEVSAKDNVNINELFAKAAESVYKQIQLKKIENNNSMPGVRVGYGSNQRNPSNTPSKRCC